MPYLPELVAVLERQGELRLDQQTTARLLILSPATADRLLQVERQQSKPHGTSYLAFLMPFFSRRASRK